MSKTQIATFAGGCFWGVEDLFRKTPGVISAVSGYMGGQTDNVTYRDVCTGTTGHAEVVQVTFDPDLTSFRELLHTFFEIHDPTTLNRQGPDHGTQYRSAVFFHTPQQEEETKSFIAWAQEHFPRPIVTEITPASTFHVAEDYHQRYFEKNGGHGCHIRRPFGR